MFEDLIVCCLRVSRLDNILDHDKKYKGRTAPPIFCTFEIARATVNAMGTRGAGNPRVIANYLKPEI